MDNIIGENLTKYDNVIIRASTIGNNVILGSDSYVQNVKLGNNCKIERRSMAFDSEIKDYSYTGFNSIIKNSNIGKFCSISWNVSVGGADHNYQKFSSYPFSMMKVCNVEKDFFEDSCEIGNDVWIGAGATILNGVNIGDGAIVGASSVVTKNIPAYAIVVGNPARVVRYRFSETMIRDLMEIRWWDWPEDFLLDNLKWMAGKEMDCDILDKMKELQKNLEFKGLL